MSLNYAANIREGLSFALSPSNNTCRPRQKGGEGTYQCSPPQYAIKLKDLAKADKRHPTLFCCALSLSTPTHFTPPIPSLLLHLDSWGPRSHISGNFLKCHSSRRPERLNSMGSIAAWAEHMHRTQWALLSPSSRLPTRWLSPRLRHLEAKSVQPCMHLCVSKPPLSLAFLRPPFISSPHLLVLRVQPVMVTQPGARMKR